MSSPESAAVRNEYDRGRGDVRHYAETRFDKGARASALCCAVIYAVLCAGAVVTIVKAALGF